MKMGYRTGLAGLALALLVALFALAMPAAAWADDLADAQSQLDDKVGQLQDIAERVKVSGKEVAALEDEIDGLLDDIGDRQAQRRTLQEKISAISKVIYKNGAQLNIAAIITNAESLSDVMDQMEVRRKVLSEYAQLAVEQERVSAELEVSYQKVSKQKDEQVAKLADLKSQREELDAAVAELQGRVDELSAAERAALEAAAQAQASAAAAAQDAGEPVSQEQAAFDGGDSGKKGSSAKDEQAAESEGQSSEAASGWQSGMASAYGGSSDDSVGNEAPTATGSTVDDYSMGVAVPLAWGPQAYYGRSVEISYGGATVVAVVNDCGGMGGGSRALDLQPGVFKAFGFSTCDDWGVREVQYRFL